MLRLQDHATWLAYAAIGFATVGVTLFSRSFVKLSLGPLYTLELVALAWLVLAGLAGRLPPPREALRALWPVVLFAGWGVARLAADLLIHVDELAALSLQRTLQHCLLFVYPALWIGVGFWSARREPRLGRLLFYLIAAAAIAPNLAGLSSQNLSVGPLAAVVFMFLLSVVMRRDGPRAARPLTVALVIALGVAAFVPFWTEWLGHISRTRLAHLLAAIALVPLLLRTPGESPWRTLRPIALAGTVFIGGLVLAPFTQQQPSSVAGVSSILQRHALDKLQHGEDRPTADDPRSFRVSHRRFMWSQAIEDWRARPVFGIGFVPEVPSMILSGVPNVGGFEAPGTPPVSGPHCSYLTVLARMGVVGALLLVTLLVHLCRRALALMREERLALHEVLVLMVAVNGFLVALLHCGFESPHRAMVMWLAAGVLLGWSGRGSPER